MRVEKYLITLGIFSVSLIPAACGSDDASDNLQGMVDLAKVEFTVREEPFGDSKDMPLSRAVGTDKPDVMQVVDLGNDLTAEVSVDRDVSETLPSTRAPLSDGRYYIYAIDSDGRRINGDATLASGVVSDGKFKLDEGTSLSLPAGTYTFICYNEYVKTNNGKLIFATDNDKALVGVAVQTLTATPQRQTVSFRMKRQIARVRFKITAYTTQAPNIAATLSSTVEQPVTYSYTDVIDNPEIKKEAISHPYTFPATTTDRNILAYDFFTGYQYYMPGVDGERLKLSFTAGEVYGKSLAGKTFALDNLGKLEANMSYTVRIKVMTNPLYLFQDGTVGIYEERGARMPIGIMIQERTKENVEEDEEGRGLAVALKDAFEADPGAGSYVFQDDDGNTLTQFVMANESGPDGQANSEVASYTDGNAGATFIYNDMKGYYWTWNEKGSSAGVVKAENKDGYPGFYAAGHYNPGVAVTGSNVGKWFVPGMGQMIVAMRKLKMADFKQSNVSDGAGMDPDVSYSLDNIFAKAAFEKAGGFSFMDSHYKSWGDDYRREYYTSTETGHYYCGFLAFWAEHFTYRRNYETAFIRPFVHF